MASSIFSIHFCQKSGVFHWNSTSFHLFMNMPNNRFGFRPSKMNLASIQFLRGLATHAFLWFCHKSPISRHLMKYGITETFLSGTLPKLLRLWPYISNQTNVQKWMYYSPPKSTFEELMRNYSLEILPFYDLIVLPSSSIFFNKDNTSANNNRR